jgi:hypothetical protein
VGPPELSLVGATEAAVSFSGREPRHAIALDAAALAAGPRERTRERRSGESVDVVE